MSIDLGSGLSFPLRVDGDGRLAWSRDDENVRDCLRVLLTTAPGERVMREGFGSQLRRLLSEPHTPTTRQLVQDTIAAAIGRWEPRVALEEVSVAPDPQEPRRALVSVVYRLVASGAVATLDLELNGEA